MVNLIQLYSNFRINKEYSCEFSNFKRQADRKICRTKSTQLATLSLFFITNIAAVFTLILQDQYFLFIPLPFAHTAHSPSLIYLPAITHVLFFLNARENDVKTVRPR